MKRNVQITNKNGKHEFLQELLNNVTVTKYLRILKASGKSQKCMDGSSSKKKSFNNTSTKLLKTGFELSFQSCGVKNNIKFRERYD